MDAVVGELAARAAGAAFFGDGDGSARVFIGLAGAPGSGKSTLAAAVCARLNAAAGADIAVVFPMDGFHYYRAQLAAFPDPEEATRRRGAPFTFDARAFVDRVRAAKDNRADATLVPAFDHEVHDPEEGKIVISPTHKVIFVEGNYLLLPDAPWSELTKGSKTRKAKKEESAESIAARDGVARVSAASAAAAAPARGTWTATATRRRREVRRRRPGEREQPPNPSAPSSNISSPSTHVR
mmetsp:Transcript_6778/g.17369  ORF Transcript_6778/g.17369 Transcript_6778/m.17369 type:complete len:239 (+) Transcript_6778:1-717(+)